MGKGIESEGASGFGTLSAICKRAIDAPYPSFIYKLFIDKYFNIKYLIVSQNVPERFVPLAFLPEGFLSVGYSTLVLLQNSMSALTKKVRESRGLYFIYIFSLKLNLTVPLIHLPQNSGHSCGHNSAKYAIIDISSFFCDFGRGQLCRSRLHLTYIEIYLQRRTPGLSRRICHISTT